MFTTTQILLAAGLALNVGAIAVVGVAFRRAVRRYRARPPAPPLRATAAATAVVDLSQEPTMRIPVPLYAPSDPWDGTPPPPAWESYIAPEEVCPRRSAAVEPGQGRRRIDPRRNAAPAAAEAMAVTAVMPVSPAVPVVQQDPDGGRWIELVLTPTARK